MADGAYTCSFASEAVSVVVGQSKRKQGKILDLAAGIAASPQSISDCRTTDAKGRIVEHLLIDEFLFSYWIDHASSEVQIIEIIRV